MTDYHKDFEKKLERISTITGHNDSEVFTMYLELAFHAYVNRINQLKGDTKAYDEREVEFERVMKRLATRDELRQEVYEICAKMFATVAGFFMDNPFTDFYGEPYMKYAGNAKLGQFFTPAALCSVMAQITLSDIKDKLEKQSHISIGEPAAGVGATVLAQCRYLYEQGIDCTQYVFVGATELDRRAYHALYIQLLLCGVPAEVRHGNTLTQEIFDVQHTLALFMKPELRGEPVMKGV